MSSQSATTSSLQFQLRLPALTRKHSRNLSDYGREIEEHDSAGKLRKVIVIADDPPHTVKHLLGSTGATSARGSAVSSDRKRKRERLSPFNYGKGALVRMPSWEAAMLQQKTPSAPPKKKRKAATQPPPPPLPHNTGNLLFNPRVRSAIAQREDAVNPPPFDRTRKLGLIEGGPITQRAAATGMNSTFERAYYRDAISRPPPLRVDNYVPHCSQRCKFSFYFFRCSQSVCL
ncbi:uncharacterized protein LAESUDRAFT_180383 [Laetiporus sulphureus 93-53]|uniref:Uncharacterized protein n=1 Tax=Laetiporus sulphureus 93-53 TaxID=1314785 RepID=A0A165E8Q9_9APHY|nr:uncharacterized protein LAESUDRAFT_180383 [Laetiporus sulphureus 93-53]KZT06480.1 hypothetical protein LAESUDRAFT_180383 [Laetiporus sulphureus 93-53]